MGAPSSSLVLSTIYHNAAAAATCWRMQVLHLLEDPPSFVKIIVQQNLKKTLQSYFSFNPGFECNHSQNTKN